MSNVPNLGSIVVVVVGASVVRDGSTVPLVPGPDVSVALPVGVGVVGFGSGPPIGGCPVGTTGRSGLPMQSAYLCPKI